MAEPAFDEWSGLNKGERLANTLHGLSVATSGGDGFIAAIEAADHIIAAKREKITKEQTAGFLQHVLSGGDPATGMAMYPRTNETMLQGYLSQMMAEKTRKEVEQRANTEYDRRQAAEKAAANMALEQQATLRSQASRVPGLLTPIKAPAGTSFVQSPTAQEGLANIAAARNQQAQEIQASPGYDLATEQNAAAKLKDDSVQSLITSRAALKERNDLLEEKISQLTGFLAPLAEKRGIIPQGTAAQFPASKESVGFLSAGLRENDQTPEEKAALETATQKARIAVEGSPEALALLKKKKEIGAEHNSALEVKPPPGYRFMDNGNLEPIPGGPAARKIGLADEKRQALLAHIDSKANVALTNIDDALKKLGWMETGFAGSLMGKIKGTDAFDVRKNISTVKAIIGFDELSKMRQSSPTGGALGQVAVQELDFLQATLGSLDADQSGQQIRRNLEAVKKHFENWQKVVKQDMEENGIDPPAVPAKIGRFTVEVE